MVQKYFEERDNVRIIDGKYKGEKATVMKVDEENQSNPTLQIDGT